MAWLIWREGTIAREKSLVLKHQKIKKIKQKKQTLKQFANLTQNGLNRKKIMFDVEKPPKIAQVFYSQNLLIEII